MIMMFIFAGLDLYLQAFDYCERHNFKFAFEWV